MALKADAELIADRTQRILVLVMLRQMAKIQLQDSPDADLTVTPEMKQTWNARINALQAEIKAVVAGW